MLDYYRIALSNAVCEYGKALDSGDRVWIEAARKEIWALQEIIADLEELS
jgi:hypothetical protein